MHFALCTIFYFLAAILVFLSYKSLRGGIDYLKFFKREFSRPKSDYLPFVSIIAPCRGLDDDLEENLAALFNQNSPHYEIIFTVDDEKDEAVSVINKLLADPHLPIAKLIIAGKAVGEAQKIHNLREAVLHVSCESEIFVFVDSDARPAANWLRNLITPLQDKKIGAATGYRWFVQKRGGLATHLRSVWNASIASALGANVKSNFCWGGSSAMRRETFEELQIREKWQGALSDDFTITGAMKEANLGIYFVPQCLTATVEDCTFRELFEFTTRQMKITRVYAPHLWKASFMGAFLFNLVLVWGILIIVLNPADSFAFWFASASLFLIFSFSTGKSFLRWQAIRLALKGYEKHSDEQFWAQNVLWVLTPALFLFNCLCALLSRKIRWRGILYEMKSSKETVILKTEIE